MKPLKNKKLYLSILVDFSFLAVLYFFILFLIKKIRSSASVLQDFMGDLSNAESVLEKNISMMDYNLLLGNAEIINGVLQKLFLLFFLLLAGSFLIYIAFQSIQWGLILNKCKNFKKYFLKFSTVNLFSFLLILFVLYNILLNLKSLFVNYFSNLPILSLSMKIILLSALFLVLAYYTMVCCSLLVKHKTFEAVKKSILFRNLKSAIAYVICVFLIGLIIVLWPILGLSNLFWIIIEVFLILAIFNWYRHYLNRILNQSYAK